MKGESGFNRRIQREEKIARHLKNISKNVDQIFKLQSNRVFRQLESYYQKRLCVQTLAKCIGKIESIILKMKKSEQTRAERAGRRRSKSPLRSEVASEYKYRELLQERENYLDNLNSISRMIHGDLEQSNLEEK